VKLRKSVPKIDGSGAHREFSVEHTLERISPHLGRMGITRVADITGLDRIGLPIYNAIVPRSNDILSVYNGKGLTPLHSRTSAIMEAAERFAACHPRKPDVVATLKELDLAGERRLRIDAVNLERFERFSEDSRISWLRGYDLLNEESVLVPQFLAGYYPLGVGEIPPFRITTTNGIASGNSLEEAICHALCELIERDDWTMSEIIGQRLSHCLRSGVLFGGDADPVAARWCHNQYLNIDLTTLPASAREVADMYARAGLAIGIKHITSELGIPCFVGTVVEHISDSFSHSHLGIGCHPDASTAIFRCLTEVAQSRVVDIHAMREDIVLADAEVDKSQLHVKRNGKVNPEGFYVKRSDRLLRWNEVKTFETDDLMTDTRLMLERLAAAGVPQVVAVDLSVADVPASVVRVIAPSIESYAVDHSALGHRAAALWNQTTDRLSAARAVAAGAQEILAC
jgi:ribosomal protein S12 methylthiotransferase accessory factor